MNEDSMVRLFHEIKLRSCEWICRTANTEAFQWEKWFQRPNCCRLVDVESLSCVCLLMGAILMDDPSLTSTTILPLQSFCLSTASSSKSLLNMNLSNLPNEVFVHFHHKRDLQPISAC